MDAIWKITDNKDWSALEKQFSWVADMKYVEQHKTHHAEGNVSIHTQMVIDELYKQTTYQRLDEQAKEILWVSALMHDIEKRSTSTDEGNGIIHTPGHAKKGELSVREILYRDIQTPFHIREQIASLVRLHGLPIWVMEKQDPIKSVLETSLRINTQHLKILAKADAKGRICDDLPKLLDSLEMYEMLCKDAKCWGNMKTFATPNARYSYFNTENGYVEYIPFDNFKCTVTVIVGLPGMGKDHYIETLRNNIPVISLDALRREHKIKPTDSSGNGKIAQLAKEEAKTYLRAGQDFTWNATNITKLRRKQLIDMCVAYGAYVKIVYIEKPYKVWRNQNRDREYPVPEVVLDKMLHSLEVPLLTEAHEVEYRVSE